VQVSLCEVKVASFFCCGEKGVFAGGFAKNCVLVVVFLWSSCGELMVKRGALTVTFLVPKNTPLFSTLFFVRTVTAWVRR
jgi:hypothetical protein